MAERGTRAVALFRPRYRHNVFSKLHPVLFVEASSVLSSAFVYEGQSISQRSGAPGRFQAAGPEAVSSRNALAALSVTAAVQALRPYSVPGTNGASCHPGEGVSWRRRKHPGILTEKAGEPKKRL